MLGKRREVEPAHLLGWTLQHFGDPLSVSLPYYSVRFLKRLLHLCHTEAEHFGVCPAQLAREDRYVLVERQVCHGARSVERIGDVDRCGCFRDRLDHRAVSLSYSRSAPSSVRHARCESSVIWRNWCFPCRRSSQATRRSSASASRTYSL